mgnify:CR=1 FL=1
MQSILVIGVGRFGKHLAKQMLDLGNDIVIVDKNEEKVEAGECHYCPKGHSHSLINNSDADLHFFATVVEQ